MSTLKVQTIQHTNGTTGITLDSGGRILRPTNPAWRIGRGSTLTGVNQITTVINYDNISDADRDFFTQGGCSVSSGVVTVPITGMYHVGTSNRFDDVGSGYIVVRITKNDDDNSTFGTYDIVGSPSSAYETIGDNTIYKLNASDTVKVDYYISNDSSFTVNTRSYFWGYLVG